MADLTHRIVEANGIRMHVAEQGSGPLVVLCHGFPESWYSWRHQLPSISGDAPQGEAAALMVPRQGGLLARWATHFVNAATLPSWLTEADVDLYVAEFTRTGFRGALNWYRNIDRNWELLAAFAGARVT